MIPKVIHYVWVGGKPLNAISKKCIKSWKKYCPDYEIKCWNETNFDINQNQYCKDAYDAKKWAFVSDFMRFKILYEYGGIYMDTDVEIIRPIDDLLNNKCFMGFEFSNDVAPGLIIGSEKNFPFFKEMTDIYSDIKFDINSLETVCTYVSDALLKYGLILNNQTQLLSNGMKIYSADYFCPLSIGDPSPIITKNTYTIHWFAGSWVPKPSLWRRMVLGIKNTAKRIVGTKNLQKIRERKKQKLIKKENNTKEKTNTQNKL